MTIKVMYKKREKDNLVFDIYSDNIPHIIYDDIKPLSDMKFELSDEEKKQIAIIVKEVLEY
jgi:hypothetical protein